VADGDAFCEDLRRVVAGGSVLDPEVVRSMITGTRSGPLADLTPRQLDVLGLMAEGRSNAGIAGDGPGLVRQAQTARPALVIADVRMPPTRSDEGLRAVREIRAATPGTPVLVISHHLQVRYAVELLALGVRATGYLLKQRLADSAQFLSSIREIADGGTVLDPEVMSVMLARLRAAGRSAAELDLLTVARVAGAFVALGSDVRGRA